MSQASEVELLMLELINQERTSRGLDPLTINNDLNASSEDHSQWMLNTDTFDHTGVGGSSATDRIEAAGYELEGSWQTAENIGWQSERGAEGIADDVADIHQSLMNSPGHRANILDPNLEDIGIGVETGDFEGFDGVMITQNFGSTDAISDVPEQETAPIVVSGTPAPVVEPTPTAEEVVVAEAPVVVAGNGPIVTTGTTSSNATVTATSGPEGPSVEVGGEGNFAADGTATSGGETVTDSASGGSLANPAPDDNTTPMAPTGDLATMFDDVFDTFDFSNLFAADDGADDVNMVTAFEGTIATPEGTVTTSDPAEFDAMFMDMAALSALSCTDHMEFG
ncbi:CAP domain-containing protein [Jannaschia sp. CCS1]|uniref:CAP domain-containing protein n=1 Tax=Jannaschia sp. (strain CCS1) TaxID=290400 RepID=UPI000053C015|nr:CAP domain-containing protein [Jannaschia sp. CCS1]ABD54073.1 Allergen V5/Tpx-1 related protein [Jannaschia sp. CCS1]